MIKVVVSGKAAEAVESTLSKLIADKVASRIGQKDFTLWGKDAESESSIRLGWVTSAVDTKSILTELKQLKSDFSSNGIDRFVLCGMGGSSLAPEVITNTAGVSLVVLDSTHPDQIQDALNGDISRTAVVVSSKSGSTVETDSQKRIFEKAFADAGIDARERIVIVTDPNSPMEAAAKADGYRIFNADPTVGGRYSALTAFGIVPSALAGADVEQLLLSAAAAHELLTSDSAENPALILGAALARTASSTGFKDKIGIISDSTPIVGFGDWAEQLIAESTGKEGHGILPVVLEADSPEVKAHQDDVLLVRVVEDATEALNNEVAVSGNLGEQFLLWEFATVIASRLIGINPFDQPDVESAKIAARAMLTQRSEISAPLFVDGTVEVRAEGLDLQSSSDLSSALSSLFGRLGSNGYVSLQAYLDRTSSPDAYALRDLVASVTARPTTFGWGPRFLHSTGQYHKGGPKQGVYLQILSVSDSDISVPGREFTFGELIASQAAGDANVIASHGVPVLTLTLRDVPQGLKSLKAALGSL